MQYVQRILPPDSSKNTAHSLTATCPPENFFESDVTQGRQRREKRSKGGHLSRKRITQRLGETFITLRTYYPIIIVGMKSRRCIFKELSTSNLMLHEAYRRVNPVPVFFSQ